MENDVEAFAEGDAALGQLTKDDADAKGFNAARAGMAVANASASKHPPMFSVFRRQLALPDPPEA
eukprot:14908124-Heterocapsa_arctica.AAC.1